MSHEGGYTYVGLLVAVAVIGVWLLAAAEVWASTARRQKVEQFDWAGQQIVRAIASYYAASPGNVKLYPRNFDDLLEDRRGLSIRRHLREVYSNPFTGRPDWEPVLTADGRMKGVLAAVYADEIVQRRDFVYQPDADATSVPSR